MSQQTLILGAGISGLAVGLSSGWPIYEAVQTPGGICSSYHLLPGSSQLLFVAPADGEAYRFEIGGGHWIFGGDPVVLHFIGSLGPVKTYHRRSAVFFAGEGRYVPYPLQNHLGQLGQDIGVKALTEIVSSPRGQPSTMADWLEQSFGPTLTEKFFGPFHELYTAGLWTRIAPQDAYKSPVDISLALRGAFDQTPQVGYNVKFIYPQQGLNNLAQRMAERCQILYGQRVVQLDPRQQEVLFADGSGVRYDKLVSTLPLNKMMEMTGLVVDQEPDPYTSVLVLNIGATRGTRCPDDHWLYNPDSQAGFHRVGFYSNVDVSFLPAASQVPNDRVSIYVERAYVGGQKPSTLEIKSYAESVVKELRAWQFIETAEVLDPTWIDVAYTWQWPGSQWRSKALNALEGHNIFQVGRYGRWIFQGIADSIRDGLMVGSALKHSDKS